MDQQEVANQEDQVKPEAKKQESSNEFDAEQVMERLKQLEASKERLENESKKWKNRYKDLESNNEEAKRERLEQEGKYQELLELEKNRNSEYQKKMNELKKQALKKELRAQIASYAKDAYDIEDVMNNLSPDILEVDEESMSIKGVQEAISSVRERKRWLFQDSKVPSTASARPIGQVPEKKDLSNMNIDEKQNLLRELIK